MSAKKEAVKQTADSLIYVIRGQKVMLDEDLARIYGVKTKALNQAVKRNADRFPEDFMFQLNEEEAGALRSQTVTSNERVETEPKPPTTGRGGRRYLPFAFTEHGTVMLASVLNSPKAVHASIQVVKAFVRLRELIAANKTLSKRLDELEDKYDEKFAVVFDAVRRLMTPPVKEPERRRVGYRRKDEKG